jgi:hypothetical protein
MIEKKLKNMTSNSPVNYTSTLILSFLQNHQFILGKLIEVP